MRRPMLVFTVVLLALAACTAPPVSRPAPKTTAATAAGTPRVVGYFTDWGVYGRDFQVKDLVTSGSADRLTDLDYAFGKVSDGQCDPADAWADYQKPIAAADSVDGTADSPTATLRGNFNQLRELKEAHPDLRLIWSFGGWTGSAGFTQAAKNPAAFAASCKTLLDDPRWKGLFDGIDIDWEYPNACGIACDTSGRDALSGMLSALRSALGPDALVTAAVPGDVSKLAAEDYVAASRSADWLSAMTYDYFEGGHKIEPHSPLTTYPGIPAATATTESTIDDLIKLGVPAGKVLLGIGFYGHGWTGVTGTAPGSAATGPATGTYEAGIEDYKTLAKRCPPTGVVGGTAYASCGTQWWSYDTPQTIQTKIAYARSRGLAGAFAWELSGDTADGALLNAMSSGFTQP